MRSSWFPANAILALLALLLLLAPLPAARAADPAADLDRAVKLFDEGNYVESQQVLVGIDRSKLNASQQGRRDDYLNRVQVAISMQEKAVRDLEDADVALKEGEKDRATRLLESVIANEYAGDTLRKAAKAKLRDAAPPPPPPPAAAPPAPAAPAQPAAAPKEGTKETVKESISVQPLPTGGETAPPANAAAYEEAKALTQQGDRLRAESRFAEAAQLYEQALLIAPGFPEAVAGLETLRQHEQVATGEVGMSLIDRKRREDEISWQRAEADYRDAESHIREHVQSDRYDEANQLLVRARQVVESSRQFAEPVARYEQLRAELDALNAEVAAAERAYHEHRVAEVRDEIEQQRSDRLRKVEAERRRQVDALVAQAHEHRKDGDLDAAVTALRQVTIIDPSYQPARFMLDDYEDERLYRKERAIRTDLYREQRAVLLDTEESKIPWHEQINYPKDWLEVISRPERSKSGRSKRDALLLGALDKPIPVNFRAAPFDQVIERLAKAHDLPIIVNWGDIERAGAKREALVDLALPAEISLKRVLTEAMQQAGNGNVELGYEVADGVITISTQRFLDQKVFPAVYDITDLLMEVPNFTDAPMTDLRYAETKRPSMLAPAAAQRSEKPWRVGDDDDDESESDPEEDGRIREVIDLIQDTIAPGSWTERGGSVGTIREFNGQLVITQNSAVQRQVADLLGKLREQRAVQVAVEARFLTVSSHYLEELGIDLDIVLNNGNAGFDYVPTASGPLTDPVSGSPLLMPRNFSRLGFTPASPAAGTPLNADANANAQPFGQPGFVPGRRGGSGQNMTPVPFSNSVTSFTNPANLGSDVPGSFAGQNIGPALSIFGSFLDNIQVDFLIRATQADSRTTVLTAPRLVLFNGQRSWVAVTIQQNFVSQLTPVVATGAVAQAPQTGTIDAGAVLDVQATVSPDKRYVCMTVRPGVTRLLDLQTIPFSGGAGGGGFGAGAANQAFIQIPTLSSQRLQTTVCVPDGGTLLIGGQKLASETEVEAGVPVLSKIPVLKRLYNSRAMVKDEQTLLILIKPKIFVQTEQEELAFPSFARGDRG